MFVHETYDAVVIGARCAGAATAMLMARKGMRVLLIDRGGYGADTISTHALMRTACCNCIVGACCRDCSRPARRRCGQRRSTMAMRRDNPDQAIARR